VSDDRTDTETQLARLADGSLEPDEAARLRARVAEDPELAAALADQERALQAMRAVEIPAPARLRSEVRALATRPRRRRAWAPARAAWAWVAATGVAVAGLAAGVAAVTTGGAAAGLSVAQASALTLRSASLPAPARDPAHPAYLLAHVGTVAFPYWETGGVRWWAAGSRTDTLSGRHAVTVFYNSHAGHPVGYSIFAGSPLRVSGGRTVNAGGTVYRQLTGAGGVPTVTWVRDGHTCIIAGRGVSPQVLMTLAEADRA
jgi:hypothetical protein